MLGGGGLAGGAWMVGALDAIASGTGWDPGTADYVLGTSAGAMLAALLATAVPPWLLRAYGAGDDLEGLPALAGAPGTRFGTAMKVHWSFPRPIVGSPSLAWRSLVEPWKYGPSGIVAWLPQGVISTEPLKDVVRRIVPRGWAPHPHLWIAAIDYHTGERVVFGAPGAPRVDLADAVAASCAIPGFYRPVRIGGRRYVDGGLFSAANLDVMAALDVGLVVCLSPMSSRHRGGLLSASGPIASFVRGDQRTVIDRDVARLRDAGKRVILFEPGAEDLAVMGYNYMNGRNAVRIAETAFATATAALRSADAARELWSLPRGARHRLSRPKGAPATWPADLFPPQRRSA